MRNKLLLMFTLLAIVTLTSGYSYAESNDKDGLNKQVHGRELMTDEEFAEHRAKMQAAKTAEERERIRKAHHEKMKERAMKKGLSMPDEPPEKGSGMGQGR